MKAAKALGFEFTDAEMDKVKAELQVLDPEALKNAAGGGWCWGDYACYTVYHHGDEGEEEACFSDYSCMGIKKGEDCSGAYKQDGIKNT